MAMKLSAFNRLKKTMMMTTSPNDNEALSALRIANNVIKEEGYTWDDVFSRLVKVHDEIEAAPEEPSPERAKSHEDREIDNAFAILETSKYRSNFIISLEEQWSEKHWLSPAQKAALFKNADRARQ